MSTTTIPATTLDSIVSQLNEKLAPLFTANFFEVYVSSGLGKSIILRFAVEPKSQWPYTYFENATGIRVMIHPNGTEANQIFDISVLNFSRTEFATKYNMKCPQEKKNLTAEALVTYLTKYFTNLSATLTGEAPKKEAKISYGAAQHELENAREAIEATDAKGFNKALKATLKALGMTSARVSIGNSYKFPNCYVSVGGQEVINDLRREAVVAAYGEVERAKFASNENINYGNISSSYTTVKAIEWIEALSKYLQSVQSK